MKSITCALCAAAIAMALGCEKKVESKSAKPAAKSQIETKAKHEPKKTGINMEEIKNIVEKFTPVEMGMEDDKIPDDLKQIIKILVQASVIIDKLYLNQISEKNEGTRKEIEKDPSNSEVLKLFDIMYGPWNRLDHNKPFWGNEQKPQGAAFYPKDLTREELTKWIQDHPDQKEAFTGYFTAIKRGPSGLIAVPFSEAYAEYLIPAATLLKQASDLANDKRLKKYLASRAESFKTNDYRTSDMDWMDLGDGALEVVIGPYEVYEDELMGYKASFESFIALRDPEESKKIAKIKSLVPAMQAFLPLPKEHKQTKRGSALPISAVDLIYSAGNARAGVQTLAFNLPNDEVVREKKGFKLVLLKNVSHEKYNNILMPIAKQLMRDDQLAKLSFEAFFNHTLLHETSHGLGPGAIQVEKDGKKISTTVNEQLKDLYSAIEETKADTLGAYLNYLLLEKKLQDNEYMEKFQTTYIASMFRSMRFGVNEAHGKANLIQFNWLVSNGAIVFENGKYACVPEKMQDALKSLAAELLITQALGDYSQAEKLINDYGQMPDDLKSALASLKDVPTDLNPTFTVEKQMANW